MSNAPGKPKLATPTKKENSQIYPFPNMSGPENMGATSQLQDTQQADPNPTTDDNES